MKEQLGNFLQEKGYINATTTLPEFEVYFIPENGNAEVVITIDYQKEIYLSEEVYSGLRERFVQSFKEQGFANAHILTLVLCKDISRIESIFSKDIFCWFINTNENTLSIPENHMEDFYGIKAKIEEFLGSPGKYSTEVLEEEYGKKHKKVKKTFRELPFMNVSIILINILVFILCTFTQDLLYNKGAFSIFLIEETGEYYRFLTSIFLHVDLEHLFSNMLMLYFMGNDLEQKIGHIPYTILYFLTAIGGNFVSAIYELQGGVGFTSVGASGAVFGIMGAILLLVIVFGGRWGNISLTRMILMVIYSLYSGFVVEEVNVMAHIGGFLTGLVFMALLYFIFRLQKKKEVLHEN